MNAALNYSKNIFLCLQMFHKLLGRKLRISTVWLLLNPHKQTWGVHDLNQLVFAIHYTDGELFAKVLSSF